MARRYRNKRARHRVRTIFRDALPGGIFRWMLVINNEGGWARYRQRKANYTEQLVAIHQLLKVSAAGRWRLLRDRHYGVRKILLERDSDVILIKLFNFEPIWRVYRIELLPSSSP